MKCAHCFSVVVVVFVCFFLLLQKESNHLKSLKLCRKAKISLGKRCTNRYQYDIDIAATKLDAYQGYIRCAQIFNFVTTNNRSAIAQCL